MKNITKELNRVYKFCKLLKIDIIKEEIDDLIKDYSLNNIGTNKGEWNCFFTREDGSNILLTLSFNNITVIKEKNNTIEHISIDENLLLQQRTVEKRQKGIIYSIMDKRFATSGRFKNEVVLVDLEEKRYVFSKDNLEKMMENLTFNKDRLGKFLLKLKALEVKKSLKEISNYNSEFSTHMNYYVEVEGGRKIIDNIYPTRTYLNGEEISKLFDVNDGPDKLYRVFDLYRGIINHRNEDDIKSINLGFLSYDTYDLKGFKGISEQEDSIVGKALNNDSDDYINYLKQLFYDKFGYKGELQLNRDSILTGITYQMSGPERAKRQIEKKIGIPYEEFAKLDISAQHNLIEQKTGKKLKIDCSPHIDWISVKSMEELTESGPKKILKRIFKPFNKK